VPNRSLAARVCAAFYLVALLLAVVGGLPRASRADAPDVYAITNARIVPVGGSVIAKGTIVLRDGLIESVGTNVRPPADARVLDGTGLSVYPGLIDAMSRVGMPAASDYPQTPRGDAYAVATVRAENNAASLLRPDTAGFDVRRREGFVAALAAPYVGVLSGTSALVSLGEDTNSAALVLKSPVAAHLNWDASDVGVGYPSSLMGEIAVSRQALYDAGAAQTRLAGYERDPKGKTRSSVSRAVVALEPILDKKLPLVIHADSSQNILRALNLAREFGLRAIVEGGAEAYRVPSELKAAGATVLLSADFPEPPVVRAGEDDPSTLQGLRRRALVPTSAAKLFRAGVPFALSTNGMERVADFRKNVRKMIAAGLPEPAAVHAATLGAARLLGADRQVGSLEPGKIASIVVIENGSLFDEKAKVKYLFVDGKRVNLPPAAAVVPAASPGGGRRGPRGSAAAPTPPVTEAAPADAAPDPNAPPSDPAAQATPPKPPVQAKPGDNPNAQTDTTDAAKRLPTRTPTDPNPAKTAPAAPPETVVDGLLPALPPALPAAFVLRHASVWTVGPQGTLPDADVFVRNGKIVSVGKNLSVPAGTREIDAHGKHVTPGMIDCHSHTAIEGGVNEGTNSVTAECRIEDVLDADDVNIYRQLAGGTTAANLLHGSANAIGGQNAVVKWRWGSKPDDLLLQGAPKGIKFALGENPKRSNSLRVSEALPRYPATRMGVEKTIRDTLVKAREYQGKWKAYQSGKTKVAPRRDLQLDAIVEILDGKRLVHCHSYRQDEILMMVRLADEFGFRIGTFQHVLEGYKVADEMARHGAGASTFSDWWAFKIEAWDAIPYNGALMAERGVVTSFNSDSSELARRPNLEAAKAVHWGGLAPGEAIKLVTINPAKQLGIDKMAGSLEPGKDADIAVWSGDPLSTLTVCEKTFVDGKLVFDRAADLAGRPAIEAEKKRLAAAERRAPSLGPSPAAGEGRPNTKPSAAPREAAAVSVPKLPSPAAGEGPGEGAVIVLTGATIHPLSGPVIPNGVLLVRGGKIMAVGAAGSVAVPNGATRVDATGKHIYPGLIDADTTLGLTEIESIRATNDSRELGDFSPELRAAVAVNPDSELLPVARANGVLHAVTAPSGGTISGMGALLQLSGWTWEDLAVVPTVGLYVNFPAMGQRRFRETAHRCEETFGDSDASDDPAFRSNGYVPAGSRDTQALRLGLLPETAQGQTPPLARRVPGAAVNTPVTDDANNPETILRPLNDVLDDARRYQTALAAKGKNVPAHERDPKFDALLPVLEGRVPLFIRADRDRDIRAAVAWAKKENLKMVLVGGQEADKAADLLARENVPVILGPTLNLPARFDSPYDDPYTLPARLHKAGVRFCLSTGDASNVRRLPYQAAMAAAFGLSPDEALKAITLYPAQILGVGARVGSLEPGKDATFIVTTGDPLEITTNVEAAYIAGRPVSLDNKHRRLYEKYRARPRK